MISHLHKAIHIHIPRTAGSSIEDALFKDEMKPENLWFGFSDYPVKNKYQMDGLQHLRASQVQTEIGDDIFDKYFKFTIVRNPFDKAVSEYHYTARETVAGIAEYLGLSRDIGFSFQEYLEAVTDNLRNGKNHPHYDLQKNFIMNDGRLAVDFIGAYESLQYDWNLICKKLRTGRIPLPSLNGTNRKIPTRNFYDGNPGCELMVAEIYNEDFELFKYQQEL